MFIEKKCHSDNTDFFFSVTDIKVKSFPQYILDLWRLLNLTTIFL